MKKTNTYQKGFTLVELIVVVAVLALLALSAVFAIRGIQRNARLSSYRHDAVRLADALNLYNSNAVVPLNTRPCIVALASGGGGVNPDVVLNIVYFAAPDPTTVYLHFATQERFDTVVNIVTYESGLWNIDEVALVSAGR